MAPDSRIPPADAARYTLATVGLTKQFRGRPAVSGLDLRVAPARVYGLLGPNGAGKSTTLKMVLGLLEPDQGTVFLFGRPWRRASLSAVGASIDGPALYEHLSAAQNLEVHGRLLGLPRERVGRLLVDVGLDRTGRQKVRTFSTGMKGRLALAVALLSDPSLLILDEPHNGLDPEGIAALRHLIRRYAAGGRSVIVSSHVLGEVAQIADDVGVMPAAGSGTRGRCPGWRRTATWNARTSG